MDYTNLFSGVDLAAAVSGLLANPLIVAALSIVLAARVGPTVVAFIKRAIGRG